MTEHHGTFEVSPPEEVAGSPVRLVYVRARDEATQLDARVVALREAVVTADRDYQHLASVISGEDASAEVEPSLADRTLAIAEQYLAFLNGGDA